MTGFIKPMVPVVKCYWSQAQENWTNEEEMKSDLIERLEKLEARAYSKDAEVIRDAITALSPVLPDDVADLCGHLQDMSQNEHSTPAIAKRLIERLFREREAPALPDDVKLQIQIARDKHAYMLARKPEFGPPDEITANFIGELADLLERQAREIKDYKNKWIWAELAHETKAELEQRIEELEFERRLDSSGKYKYIDELQAQVEELESYTKHLETEWVLTDDLDEARASWAALQENEL